MASVSQWMSECERISAFMRGRGGGLGGMSMDLWLTWRSDMPTSAGHSCARLSLRGLCLCLLTVTASTLTWSSFHGEKSLKSLSSCEVSMSRVHAARSAAVAVTSVAASSDVADASPCVGKSDVWVVRVAVLATSGHVGEVGAPVCQGGGE